MAAGKQYRAITSNISTTPRRKEMYTLDIEDLLIVLRALYWYDDKLRNTERDIGRDIYERDKVMNLRTQLGNLLKAEAKI
jgi:hypothetical protein